MKSSQRIVESAKQFGKRSGLTAAGLDMVKQARRSGERVQRKLARKQRFQPAKVLLRGMLLIGALLGVALVAPRLARRQAAPAVLNPALEP